MVGYVSILYNDEKSETNYGECNTRVLFSYHKMIDSLYHPSLVKSNTVCCRFKGSEKDTILSHVFSMISKL